MTKHSVRRSVRPALEVLEDRCTPTGSGAVTGSLAGGVWKLTGDNDDNQISVASAGKPGAFTVTGTGTTVNGVTNPTGVKKIVFDMKGDNDNVMVIGARLKSMAFNGGDGNNTFFAERFALANGLQVVNGVGRDSVYLHNFKVGGNVNINNGSGGATINLVTLSSAAGFNNIAGSVNITNGAGYDSTTLSDTDVGGNITANNGAGDGVHSGYVEIYNTYQTGRRALVGGNVTVTFQDGNYLASSGFSDLIVRGSVLFNNGSGVSSTDFDGFQTKLPVVIQGRLKIIGTGANTVIIGRTTQNTGLRVGQNLVFDMVQPTDLTLEVFRLIVNGQTKII